MSIMNFHKKLIPIAFILAFISNSHAQNLLVLQPDSLTGNDAFVWTSFPNSSFSESGALDVTGWTLTGTPYSSRIFFSFDLSSIPASATLLDAKLTLYHNPTDMNYNGVHSGANASVIQRVTSPWLEDTLTWNNQPTTTTLNEITFPATTTGTEDFADVDVTLMVDDMLGVPDSSFGFMLRLQVETPFKDLIFASSNHSVSFVHPKLVINYLTSTGIVENNDLFSNVSVFPNPVIDYFSVKGLKEPVDLKLFDLLGKTVLELKVASENSNIDVQHLVNGVYFYELHTDNGAFKNGKLVKY